MTPLRHRRLWLCLGAGFVLLVIYLSLTPQPIDAGQVGEVKTGHFVAYAWLMFWYSQLYRGGNRAVVLISLALMGVGLEYAQGLTSYRTLGYSDMRDNIIGLGAGYLLALTPLGRALEKVEAKMGPSPRPSPKGEGEL